MKQKSVIGLSFAILAAIIFLSLEANAKPSGLSISAEGSPKGFFGTLLDTVFPFGNIRDKRTETAKESENGNKELKAEPRKGEKKPKDEEKKSEEEKNKSPKKQNKSPKKHNKSPKKQNKSPKKPNKSPKKQHESPKKQNKSPKK